MARGAPGRSPGEPDVGQGFDPRRSPVQSPPRTGDAPPPGAGGGAPRRSGSVAGAGELGTAGQDHPEQHVADGQVRGTHVVGVPDQQDGRGNRNRGPALGDERPDARGALSSGRRWRSGPRSRPCPASTAARRRPGRGTTPCRRTARRNIQVSVEAIARPSSTCSTCRKPRASLPVPVARVRSCSVTSATRPSWNSSALTS